MLSGAAGTMLSACTARRSGAARARIFVVAFDGLDPNIVDDLMAAGALPNLKRLAARGAYRPITTTTPAITPVAFSTIVSGVSPAAHNIYDFIHRDPAPASGGVAIAPYFSLSETTPPTRDWAIPMGEWRLPLSGGGARSLRRGPSFWDELIAAGHDVDAYHIPGTWPPPEPEGSGRFRCLSGMGTPDLLGTYGEFTVFSTAAEDRRVGGGRFARLELTDHVGTGAIEGPPNFLRPPNADGTPPAPMTVDLRVARDPEHHAVRLELGAARLVLNRGDWSDWIPIDFETHVPGDAVLSTLQAPTSIRGMVRVHVRSVHPELELYVSALHLDPMEPANAISTPPDFAADLAARQGRFHTTGIPEDTKALSHGALDPSGFLAQVDRVMEEKVDEYRHALAHFEHGCLFTYFGSTDLVQHMFWRDRDLGHPARNPQDGTAYASVIDDLYRRVDALVGDALDAIRDDDILLVLSDHGFTTFRHEVSLNTWLYEHGDFIGARRLRPRQPNFGDVDWSRTRAYAMGLNGIYLNQQGREANGIVSAAERDRVLDTIASDLLALRDDRGRTPIASVQRRDDLYPNADPRTAPDLFVGYNHGFRASWSTVLGDTTTDVFRTNTDRWSGTHCIAPDLVPGVIFSNRPFTVDDPDLRDIAPTILHALGVARPAAMTGRPLLAADPDAP